MAGSLLRDRHAHDQSKVTFVELFFDLVFVFAVTQLSHHLLEQLTLAGVLETGLLLLGVWTVWVYTTWAANWLDTNRAPVRLMFFGLMGAGLVLSMSIPEAFTTRGIAFGVSFALMQNGRNLFLLWCLGGHDRVSSRNFWRIEFWLALGGVLWIAGGLASPEARPFWWAAALAVEFGSPWWRFWTPGLGVSSVADWHVSAHHFAERCGLFVIIALGESILVTGVTFSRLAWDAATTAAFVASLAGSVAMWWVYFATTADEASKEMAASETPGRLARDAYTYSHLPLVAGIIVSAVGDELVLAHPSGHASGALVAAVAGGAALFLAGSAIFNRLICGVWPRSHVAGLLLVVGCAGLAAVAPPVVVASAVAAVLAGVGAWETKTAGARGHGRR
jgi:low temperature requirement protein LtrA